MAVRVPADPPCDTPERSTIEAARGLASRSVVPHVARVRRWLRARALAEATRDHALHGAVGRPAGPAEAQPGLFDRRGVHALDAARQAAALIGQRVVLPWQES